MQWKFETKRDLRDKIEDLEFEIRELKKKEKLRQDMSLEKCGSRLCFACGHAVFARQDKNYMPFLAGCAKGVKCKDFVNATSALEPCEPPVS